MRPFSFEHDGRNEGIALARNVDHIPSTVLPIAECPTQTRYLYAKTARIYHQSSPDACDQLSIADYFAGAFHKHNQDVQRAAAQLN
jgi:hypothetical protein